MTGRARPRIGTCWFPEQWPRERWDADVDGMVEAGLSIVRLGEFAWSWYEPRPGRIDLSGLDDAIALLRGAGLDVMLCTPTATPPRWLTSASPEVLATAPDGHRRDPGSRRHTCLTSATYREHSRRITRVLAERYGSEVDCWQLDNEPGNHDSARCWCDECETAFRQWVLDRYDHDLDELNRRWGLAFWSGGYGDPDEIVLPRPTVTDQSPALELAHRRFASQQVASFVAEQRDVVRSVVGDAVTVTNEYADDEPAAPTDVARVHGRAAIDSYPHGTRDPWHTAYLLDLARGASVPAGADAAADGGRVWVVEQQPGRINWTPYNAAVPSGQVRTWTWQALLHGVDTLLFFRWRAAAGGQEQYHAGLLRHDGSPGVGWHDARAVTDELRRDGVAGLLPRPPARTAVVVDHETRWALSIEQHVAGAGHDDLVLPAYTALRRLGLDVDVVPPDVDLRGYDLVVAPAVHLRRDDLVAALLARVDAGAVVVVGARSLTRTVESGWVTERAPAGLAARLGAHVVDAGAIGTWPDPSETTVLAADDGTTVSAVAWAESLVLDTASTEVLLWHTDPWRADQPAVVRRGGLVYVGAAGHEVWDRVLRLVAPADLPTTPRDEPGDHVERFHRPAGTVTLDHDELTVTWPSATTDLHPGGTT